MGGLVPSSSPMLPVKQLGVASSTLSRSHSGRGLGRQIELNPHMQKRGEVAQVQGQMHGLINWRWLCHGSHV